MCISRGGLKANQEWYDHTRSPPCKGGVRGGCERSEPALHTASGVAGPPPAPPFQGGEFLTAPYRPAISFTRARYVRPTLSSLPSARHANHTPPPLWRSDVI